MKNLNEKLIKAVRISLKPERFTFTTSFKELQEDLRMLKKGRKINADELKLKLINQIDQIDVKFCNFMMSAFHKEKELVLELFKLLQETKMASLVSYTNVMLYVYAESPQSNYDAVIELYNQAKQRFPYELNTFFYTALIFAATKHGAFTQAEDFFYDCVKNAHENQTNMQVEDDYKLHQAYLEALLKGNKFAKAKPILEKVIRLAREQNISLKTIFYIIVENAIKFRQYNFAKDFFSHRFIFQDLHTVACNQYIEMAISSHDFPEAIRFCTMLVNMKVTNEYHVSLVINGVEKIEDYFSAKKLFMLAFYKNQLASSAYSSLMTAAGKLKLVDEVEHAYQWACDTGAVDQDNAYMFACGECGRLDSALNVFEKLRVSNQDCIRAYSTIIVAASKNAAWDLVNKYYELALEKYAAHCSDEGTLIGCEILLTHFLSATTNKNQYAVAKQKYEQAKSRGINNKKHINTMIHIAAKFGDFDESKAFFEQVPSPDEYTYTSWINALGKAGRYDEAKSYFDEAVRKKIIIIQRRVDSKEISQTALSMMIHIASINKQYADAEYYYKLLSNAQALTAQAYPPFIDAAGDASKFSAAKQAYLDALHRKCVSFFLFNSFINAAGQCGEIDEAITAFERAVELERANNNTYKAIINVLIQAGHVERAKSLYQVALNKGLFDVTLCKMMVNITENNNKFNVFQHGFNQAISKKCVDEAFCREFVACAEEHSKRDVIVASYSEEISQHLTDIQVLQTLILESGKQKRFDAALLFYNKAGTLDNVDAKTHCIFIKVACELKQFEAAEKAIESLLAVGTEPSDYIDELHSVLPYALLKKLYMALLKKGVPTSQTCLQMMHSAMNESQCNKQEQPKEVDWLRKNIETHQLFDIDIYLALIQFAFEQKNTSSARHYWKIASQLPISHGKKIELEERYLLLMTRSKDLDDIKTHFLDMHEKGLTRSETYHAMIDFANQHSEFGWAEYLYYLCLEENKDTAKIHNAMLLTFLNNQKDYTQAVNIFNKAQERNKINATVCMTMMTLAAQQATSLQYNVLEIGTENDAPSSDCFISDPPYLNQNSEPLRLYIQDNFISWFKKALDDGHAEQSVIRLFVDLLHGLCETHKTPWIMLDAVTFLFKNDAYDQTFWVALMLFIAEYHYFEAIKWLYQNKPDIQTKTECAIALIESAESGSNVLSAKQNLKHGYDNNLLDLEVYTAFINACYKHKLPDVAASVMLKSIKNGCATDSSCKAYLKRVLAEGYSRSEKECETIVAASTANLIDAEDYQQLITLINTNTENEVYLFTLFDEVKKNGRMTSVLLDQIIRIYLTKNQTKQVQRLLLDNALHSYISREMYEQWVDYCVEKNNFSALMPVFERALADRLVDKRMCGLYIKLARKHQQMQRIQMVFDLAPDCVTPEDVVSYALFAYKRKQFDVFEQTLSFACYLKIANPMFRDTLYRSSDISQEYANDLFKYTTICFMELAISQGDYKQVERYLEELMPRICDYTTYDCRNWSYQLTMATLAWLEKNKNDTFIMRFANKNQNSKNAGFDEKDNNISPTYRALSDFCNQRRWRFKVEQDGLLTVMVGPSASNKRALTDYDERGRSNDRFFESKPHGQQKRQRKEQGTYLPSSSASNNNTLADEQGRRHDNFFESGHDDSQKKQKRGQNDGVSRVLSGLN